MALDINKWDERIRKDLMHRINTYDKKWDENRQTVRNAEQGKLKGNLVQDFIDTIQSRLIVRNPVIKVTADSADYSKRADDLEISANSIVRVCDMRFHLTRATITATWCGTGWIEVGHTMDQHNFDPMRSVLYRSPDAADLGIGEEPKDSFVQVPEQSVMADIGGDIEKVPPFDPFESQEMEEPIEDPPPAFDPELGMPWVNEVSPFMIVIPKENDRFVDLDYIAKLVVISKQELKLITNVNVENVRVSQKYKSVLSKVSGFDQIDDPVLLCVAHIRRDRNDPSYTNWYLVHVLGHPDVVIKSDNNPFGGLIPLVPIQISPIRNVWDSSVVEDLKPYAKWYSAGVEAIGDRLYETLNQKVLT